MEISADHHMHPIMQLRDDVLNFIEAIDAQPGSEINKTGLRFARLLKELHNTYQIECTIERMESCFNSPDYIKPPTKFSSSRQEIKKESGQRKKGKLE